MRRSFRTILHRVLCSRLGPTAILVGAVVAVCALAAMLDQGPRRVRRIHMEFFRYGTDPYVIRARRGDRIVLDMRSLDTGHSFFLQEYDLDAKVTPGTDLVEIFHPSRPEALPERVRQVAFRAGRSGAWGRLCSKARFRCHVYCGPMHGFEHGDFVLWPNWLLLGGLTVLVLLPVLGVLRVVSGSVGRASRPGGDNVEGEVLKFDLFARFPGLKSLFPRRTVRDRLSALMTVVLYVVVLAGLLGTKMPGRNLAIMAVWVLWLFLVTVFLTPLGGRIWCYVCPLPFFGDLLQRRARRSETGRGATFAGFSRPWPEFLSGAWLRTFLFLTMGTFSTLLATSPRTTAWVLVGTTAAAFLIAMVFERRAFCRYVCPVNTFIGLYAAIGKLAMRPCDAAVCGRCRVSTCLWGDGVNSPCPYGLRLGDVRRNNDCGLCGECVLTCAHDNVGLWVRPFGEGGMPATFGEGWQAIVMLVLAVAYCITHLGPWPEARVWVDLVDRKRWDLFLGYWGVLWGVALLGVPLVQAGAAALGRRLVRSEISLRRLFLANCGALVPMGLMVWVAFAVAPVMVNLTFVIAGLSDPFGWNWDLFGTANMPWHQVWPSGLPWIQTAAILTGVGYGLRNGWRGWLTVLGAPRRAIAGFAPAALFLLGLGAWLVVFFADSPAGP